MPIKGLVSSMNVKQVARGKRWSAIPLPCFMVCCEVRGSRAAAPKGTKSCRTQGDFHSFVNSCVRAPPIRPLRPQIWPLRLEIWPVRPQIWPLKPQFQPLKSGLSGLIWPLTPHLALKASNLACQASHLALQASN